MATKYDQEQDKRIFENSEAIQQLAEYMHQIRDFHMPWAHSPFQTKLWKRFIRPTLKISAGVTIGLSLYKGLAVYREKQKLYRMANRYAQVAERLYYQENNAEVALPFLEKAISIDKECPEYLFTRAYMQGMAATRTLSNLMRPYNKSELDLAHKSLAEAVYLQGLEPERPEPYILEAQIRAVLKETALARAAIDKAIALDPKNDFAYIRLAMIQLDCEKDVKGAEATLEKAMALNPKSKWVWLWKGILETEFKGNHEAARVCCGKALEIDPKFDLALYNKGWTYARGKSMNYGLAREDMKRALSVNPEYKEACYAIGMFYGYEDNYSVARVWMEKAIAMDAKFLPAHKWRGIICGEMGEWSEAVASLNKAILLDPMNAELYVRRAKMYGKLKRDKDELEDLRFAYEINPKATRTLLYLGDVYDRAGDSEKALKYYDEALSVDPKYDDAYAHKAALLCRAGKNGEALAALDAAIATTRYKPERYWLQKGELIEKSGDMKGAVGCYAKARTLDAKMAAAWKCEARVLKTINSEGYKAALARYLELVPNDAAARAEYNGVK